MALLTLLMKPGPSLRGSLLPKPSYLRVDEGADVSTGGV
jgi:hypothetical protein